MNDFIIEASSVIHNGLLFQNKLSIRYVELGIKFYEFFIFEVELLFIQYILLTFVYGICAREIINVQNDCCTRREFNPQINFLRNFDAASVAYLPSSLSFIYKFNLQI